MTRSIPRSAIFDTLAADRAVVDHELSELLTPGAAGRCGPVLEAMRYATLGGGQRIRPLLAFRIARTLAQDERLIRRQAAAIELLHCASLIIDDLPCMDDEAERRGRPATHAVFGEAVAILAAFGLVALAARCSVDSPADPADVPALLRFQEHLLSTLDCDGLIAGQAMDLGLAGSGDRGAVADLKTVPLFELSARAGALFAHPASEPAALEFARAYGSAFQLTDDFLDGDPVGRSQLSGVFRRLRAAVPAGERRGELLDLVQWLEDRAA